MRCTVGPSGVRCSGGFDSDYVSHYEPKPYSKRFVRHLELWYAQSHPAEDFAETFAVWLDPSSRWRSRYRGWPALSKLNFLRAAEWAKSRAKDRSSAGVTRIEPIDALKQTLGDYYREKRARLPFGPA